MATAKEAEHAYTYETLEEPDKSIRLLKILSVTPRITCALKVAHLKDSPVFSCLSYVWGDATITEPVTIEGKTLHITVNLAGAIRDVHCQWSAGQLLAPGEEQWLWADALCINQKNLQEKNHQVPLMEEIYSSAHRVFAWLGREEDERASKAVDAYHIILHAISRIPEYGYIRDKPQNMVQFYSKEEIAADAGAAVLGAITDSTWLREHYKTQPDLSKPLSTLNDALQLFQLPYWTRLWILQEVVLAKDAILLCGPKKISWLEVCGVQFWIRLCKVKHSSSGLPDSIPISEWTVLTEYGLSEEYTRICFLKSFGSLRNTVQRHQSVSPTNPSYEVTLQAQFKEEKTRFNMSERALHYQATEAKDYAYALSGVIGLRIPTDYSSETTVAQVYQSYAVQWLNALAWGEASEGNDPYYRLLCDLWFLTYAGIGFLRRPIPGLPSWVPNLKGVAESQCNWKDEESTPCFLREKGVFNDSGIFPQGTQRATWLDTSLCCSAVAIEESISIGPRVHSYKDFDSHSFEEDKWLLWLYDLMVGRKHMMIPILTALYSLDKGLTHLPLLHAAHLLLADLEFVCRKRRSIPRVLFDVALGWRSYHVEPDDSDGMSERRLISLKVALMQENEEESQVESELNLRVTISVLVYQQALRSLHKFRLASTSSGLFGIFPPSTEDGDMVWVLKGFTLPVVLRRHGDGYQLVGACNIPQLKASDVGGNIQDGRAPVQNIRIY